MEIFIYILIILNIFSFLLGYLYGNRGGIQSNIITKKQNSKVITQSSNIEIDDKKFVTDINTAGLEKKYDQLGDIKNSQTNISSSVNKLKNMKS